MTSRERTQRDRAIFEARARGRSYPSIARQHGLTERHCRRIVADHRNAEPVLDRSYAVEVVEDTIDAYDAAIEDLAELAATTNHDSAKLGALKARLEAYTKRIELFQSLGLLPSDLDSSGSRSTWTTRRGA